jgi:hypothetical protein
MHKQKLWGCYLDFADISRLVDHDAYRRRLPHLLVHPGAQNVRKVHQELSRGILADILLAEREGRGSEAVHELRNERQLAKRNVLPDVPTSAATVLPRVVVDLSRIRRINWRGSASNAVPSAAGDGAAVPDLLVKRRIAARTQHGVHVTTLLLLWLLRGASGRVNMLTRRLRPGVLVFATAIAVPLQTVSNAVRLASLLMISGGERAALAVALLALINVSSCLAHPDLAAARADGLQSASVSIGEGPRRGMIWFGLAGKKSDPLLVVSVLSRLA